MLSAEGRRAKLAHVLAVGTLEHRKHVLHGLSLFAKKVAMEIDLVNFDIDALEEDINSDTQQVTDTLANYNVHYMAALEEVRQRDDDEGMPWDSSLLANSSSPVRAAVHRRSSRSQAAAAANAFV